MDAPSVLCCDEEVDQYLMSSGIKQIYDQYEETLHKPLKNDPEEYLVLPAPIIVPT